MEMAFSYGVNTSSNSEMTANRKENSNKICTHEIEHTLFSKSDMQLLKVFDTTALLVPFQEYSYGNQHDSSHI